MLFENDIATRRQGCAGESGGRGGGGVDAFAQTVRKQQEYGGA